jgi:hypothetical protein
MALAFKTLEETNDVRLKFCDVHQMRVHLICSIMFLSPKTLASSHFLLPSVCVFFSKKLIYLDCEIDYGHVFVLDFWLVR